MDAILYSTGGIHFLPYDFAIALNARDSFEEDEAQTDKEKPIFKCYSLFLYGPSGRL
ncbi:hypothetical protein [Butyrivibrio sp. AE3004]|uniref:hypothetical protein n=1 Tax=Butyrivibrio sp. AE3004 TaxID=1506994 RepID=UPI000B0659C4|nr:hypothetical protein [Butyrivibrio sp. AE3004]